MENKSKELYQDNNIARLYIMTALPLVFSLLVNVVNGLIDTYFVSSLGNTDLIAGINLCAPVVTIMMAIGNIFAQGGTSLISRMLGGSSADRAEHTGAFCFWGCIGMGVIFTLILVIFKTPILYMLGANEGTMPFANEYYSVYMWFAPIVAASYVHFNLFRAEGMAAQSMIGSVSGILLHMALVPFLVPKLGATGAAIAGVVGYTWQVGYYVVVVILKSRILSVNPAKAGISLSETGQIFGIGIPAALTTAASSIAAIVMNHYLLVYGNDKVAAKSVAMVCVTLVNLTLTGFTFGGGPIFGYFYGAKNNEKLAKVLKFAFRFIFGLGLVMSIIIFVAAKPMVVFFLKDPTLSTTAAAMLRWLVCTASLAGIIQLITIISQSCGMITESLILSIGRQGVIYLSVTIILANLLGYTGVLATQAVSDIIALGLAYTLYHRRFRNFTPVRR